MVIVEAILAFILLVGILVFVHELGHFLAARKCGIRVDVFAVGMGPRLLGWNSITGFTFGRLPLDLDLNGRVDYRLSAFPIGGYVKIVGMVDESMDTEFAHQPPQPWEFRTKGTLQKAFVITAGVIMNFLLAIVVFAGLALLHGDEKSGPVVGPLYAAVDSTLIDRGLRAGDSIVSVAGVGVSTLDEADEAVRSAFAGAGVSSVAVGLVRDGRPVTATLSRSVLRPTSDRLFPPQRVTVIESVVRESPAEKAGLRKGDTVVAIANTRTSDMLTFTEKIQQAGTQPVRITVARAGGLFSTTATPNDDGKIMVALAEMDPGPTYRVTYPLGRSLAIGVERTASVTAGTFELVGRLVTGQARLKESVGGPTMIASYAQKTISRGLPDFLALMAILSVTLACMNILPIPALDGGHLVFIVIEGIIRREVSLKVRMAFQQVGFALLIIFMVFVFYNDIARMISN